MMAGLIIRDPDGNITLDSTKNIAKILGSFETGTSGGSFTAPITMAGTVFYLQTQTGNTASNGKLAAVVNTGNVFTWAFSYPGDRGFYSANSRVYYGVY